MSPILSFINLQISCFSFSDSGSHGQLGSTRKVNPKVVIPDSKIEVYKQTLVSSFNEDPHLSIER